jgi:hypothetical protein
MLLENKIRIFGHYLFCKAKCDGTVFIIGGIDNNSGMVYDNDSGRQYPIENCKLILKNLKNINLKNAAKCAMLANLPAALYKNWVVSINDNGLSQFSYPGEYPNYRYIITFKEDILKWEQIDYLRSEGYAIDLPTEIYEIEP